VLLGLSLHALAPVFLRGTLLSCAFEEGASGLDGVFRGHSGKLDRWKDWREGKALLEA